MKPSHWKLYCCPDLCPACSGWNWRQVSDWFSLKTGLEKGEETGELSKMLFSLLVALLTVLPPTRGLDLVNSSPDQSCSRQEVCATKSSCAHWVEREAQYKEGRDPSYLTDARAHICNKQLRALCCPRPPQLESPAFIPVAGQCGTNPEAPATPDSRFVFGGNNTDPGDYPFSALLGLVGFKYH